MNCVNHPEAAVTAFCQHCGKGLCAQCTREVQGNVFCEPCLAARVTGGEYGADGFRLRRSALVGVGQDAPRRAGVGGRVHVRG